MNFLEKQVLRIIGEDPAAPDVFTDDDAGIKQVRDSLSDAVQEITILEGGHQDNIHVPLLTDKKFYRIGFERGSFGWVVDAWMVGNKRRLAQTDLIRLRSEDPGWLRRSGPPQEYFQVGANVIGLDSSPSSSSDLLELRCVVIPAPYTRDTDHPALREEFKWAAVNYAVSEYWVSRGDATSAVRHLQIYTEALGGRLSYDPAPFRARTLKSSEATAQ